LLDRKPAIVKNLHLKVIREVSVTKAFKMQESVTFAVKVQNKGLNYLIIGASDQTILLYSEVDGYQTYKTLYFSSHVSTAMQLDEETICIGSYRALHFLNFDENGFLFKSDTVRVEESVMCIHRLTAEVLLIGQYQGYIDFVEHQKRRCNLASYNIDMAAMPTIKCVLELQKKSPFKKSFMIGTT
jgi:hypothetical protein